MLIYRLKRTNSIRLSMK